MESTQRRAVILTALPIERASAVEHLSEVVEELHPNGSVYRRGVFRDRSEPWDVLLAEIGAGNEGAAAETERAISYFNPLVAVFVGVAGAIKDLKHGDVVCSTKVYNYESGKDRDKVFETRPETELPGYALLSRARHEAGESHWLARIKGGPASGAAAEVAPEAKVAPIAAGPKVLASTRSAVYKFVREHYGDAAAVEMEGYGFLRGVRMNHPVQGIVVRGISDRLGDKTAASDENWQPIAARHAAAFAFQLLAKWAGAGSRRPPQPTNSAPAIETRTQGGVDHVSLLPGGSLTDDGAKPPGSSGPATDAGDELKVRFARASVGLLRWPTTLSGDRWLDRPELKRLTERVATTEHSASVILGPPGCGKSAFLARLGQQLVSDGFAVLAVKADQLRNSIDSLAKLTEWLDLPAPVDQAILAVARGEPVVVLFDQLDALGDLADLKSERLHVLLNLFQRLAGQPGVHVVCSCREFEYQHDGRLNRLDADAIRLQSPAWEQVSEVLVAHDIDGGGWPADAKALLRVPYYLSLFLKRLRGPGEQPLFTTYQQLFTDLWDERVLRPGDGRPELLHDLAGQLAEQEEQWADRSGFEHRWTTVENLIAADILRLTEDGFRVGFRHQSLFEFVRARTFARDTSSLAAHVVARQDALFVRPTLWTTLNYLRRANPAVYAREFDLLWRRPDLRRHVKHLLIDFLSQVEQPPPGDWEQARLIAALRDGSWRRKVLTAVAGKEAWFELLAGPHLSAEMRKPPEEAWDVVWVLVAAFGFGRDRCLQLMEQNWLPDDAKLTHVWQALTHLGEWDERSAGLATAVVRRTDVNQGVMWRLAQTIAKGRPALAVGLVAEWLDAARRRIASAPAGEGDDRGDRLGKVLESHNQWHDVGELAEQAPAEFVLGVWPVLREIVTDLRGYASEYVVRYAEDRLRFDRLDRREYAGFDSPDQFFLALDAAVREFARRRPEDFCSLVRATGNPDSRLLQRLMCRGLREVVSTHPGVALEFLTSDARRFWLGGLHDDLGDSRELVAALAPHLGDEQFARLAAAIRSWEVYREREGEPRDPEDIYARGYRFRLLSALPAERLPDDVRRELTAESASLPDYAREARPRTGTGLRLIGSPTSLDEMAGLKDDAIAGLFDELPDATEDHHPKDWMVGGSVQLSREFEEFAKAHPDRAVGVIARLRPGDQERPAAHGVRGLVAAKRPVSEVIDIVERLDARGFTGREFRETVAFALGDLAGGEGLPDAACALLHRWRLAVWPDNEREESDREEREPDRPTSILWQFGGTFGLPPGRFPVLSALTRGYLCRKPHAADLWLDMLADHIEREESLTNWRAMCLYLRDVRCCSDRNRAGAFLARLFERFPRVLNCQVGVRLLGGVAHLLTEEQRRRAYETVRGWDAERGGQAFGELVCLRHLAHPEDEWAKSQVGGALAAPPAPGRDWVLVGIAFASANLWDEPACRTRATELLCRLLPTPSNATAYAVLTVFHTRDELPIDEPTLALLRQVQAHPEALVRGDVDEVFFDHLLDAFAVDPELVCRISEEAVRRRGSELRSAQHRFFMAASAMIDISLRLQRSGGDYRRRGMELFEQLLDLGVAEAISVVRNNDLRLASGPVPIRSPRRRRSGQAGSKPVGPT